MAFLAATWGARPQHCGASVTSCREVCVAFNCVQDDPRWSLADPICTFIFAGLVLLTTHAIIKDIIHVLMERTPTQLDLTEMSQSMKQVRCLGRPGREVGASSAYVWAHDAYCKQQG